MKFRVARHTKSVSALTEFYTKNIGLEILGEFKSHDNYDGTFVGKKGGDWHLEFTVSDDLPVHHSDEDDLLVFYVNTDEEYDAIIENFKKNGIPEEEPKNPYWKKNAKIYKDPDGFLAVVCLRKNL